MPLFSQQRPRPAHPSAAPAPAPDPAGTAASQLLRRYRPLETRAAGGFGSVEICLDSRLQRRVAIKRMPLAADGSGAPRQSTAAALAEARTASMLQHPNIVSVIDFSYDAAHAYLVMEYVDGMSLEEFLAQVDGHSLTYDEAAAIADALTQALSYAHENGVLHLDIKPANVLIDRSGHVKLTDFGMASLASAAGFGGARGGTVGYMSPEQLEGREVDERSDLFSLAAVLYEALCGTAPFRAGTPADSLKRIEEGVVYPADLLPDLPESAEDALLAALISEAEGRPLTVPEFADAFLAQLGDARAGRKSLERMIAQLTSDEEDGTEEPEEARPRRVWELDPAEGHLGSRWPRARRVAAGCMAGASAALVAWSVLGTMGVAHPLGRAVVALACGAAAGAAPQIGSALVIAALLVMIANATALLPLLPVAILLTALGVGWWLAWGRTLPAASAVLNASMACVLVGIDPLLAAAPIAAIAGYALPPAAAAAALGLGLPLGALANAATSAGGALPLDAAIGALARPALWIATLGPAALAAAVSLLLARAWSARREGRGGPLYLVAYLLPCPSLLLIGALANRMEITASTPEQTALAVGAAILSSILVWICVFSLGMRVEPEGDRS